MPKAINMPKMGNTVESVIVGEIKINVGDTIKHDDVLFTYETDKSTTEYKAESADEGKVIAIFMEEGEEIPVLLPVIVTGEESDDVSEFKTKRYAESESEESTPAVKSKSMNNASTGSKSEVSFGGSASPRAKATAQNLGVNLSVVGGSGIDGRIQESDVLSFFHSDGTLATGINASGNFEYKELLIQAMAKELGFTIATNVEPAKNDTPPAPAHPAGGGQISSETPTPEGATRKQFSPVRTAIANTMMNSLMQTAQLTMGITIDASALMEARAKIKKQAANGKHANSSINDIIIFALSRVLPKHSHLNAQVGADYSDQFDVAHISVAVDTPHGLFVPVVQNATNKSLSEITDSTKDLITKAQGAKLGPADMQGGTFTISNLGLSGVSFFTPVLNPPQAGLLGVGSPIKRLKLDDKGKVVEYPEITLSLTMDHRPNDGVAGTMFLKEMKETLENINSLIK